MLAGDGFPNGEMDNLPWSIHGFPFLDKDRAGSPKNLTLTWTLKPQITSEVLET